MQSTEVSRCLDRKLTMCGFEIPDILAIFLSLSVLNFVFGRTSMKLVLVWLPTILLAAVLRWGKKGKPDKYLIHWLRFQIKPGVYSAFSDPSPVDSPPRLTKEGK